MTARGHLTQKQKAELILKQKGKCAKCPTKLVAGMFEFDHIQDLQFDGDNELDNWQILCTCPPYRCHKVKTRKASKAASKMERVAVGGKQKKSGFRGWRKFDNTIVWAERK